MAEHTVLVTGATGTLGREVVSLLLRRRVKVRALARSPRARETLAASFVEVATGDYRDAASLVRACAGVERVIACAGRGFGPGPTHLEIDGLGTARLAAAARDAGVARFVFVSALGAGRGLDAAPLAAKEHAERAVAASGVPHVVLRPAPFHTSALRLARAAWRKRRVLVLGDGRARTAPVCVGDVAEACVRAALEDGPDRLVELGGPEVFTQRGLAKALARQVGRPDARVVRVPIALARASRDLAARLSPAIAGGLELALAQASADLVPDERALGEAWPGLVRTSIREIVRRELVSQMPAVA